MGMHLGVVWCECEVESLVTALKPTLERGSVGVERRELANLGEWLPHTDRRNLESTTFAFVRTPQAAVMLVSPGVDVSDQEVVGASTSLGRVGGAVIETSGGGASLWMADSGVLVRSVEDLGDDEGPATTGEPMKFEPPIESSFYMTEMDGLMRNLGLYPIHDAALESIGPVVAFVVTYPPRDTKPKPAAASVAEAEVRRTPEKSGRSAMSILIALALVVLAQRLFAYWIR